MTYPYQIFFFIFGFVFENKKNKNKIKNAIGGNPPTHIWLTNTKNDLKRTKTKNKTKRKTE